MLRTRVICLLLAAACITGLCVGVSALEVESGSTYCFGTGDFEGDEPLSGICITELPDPKVGTVMLGHRVLRPGDILTAQQLNQMTFVPLDTQSDAVAQVSYLPIYETKVAEESQMFPVCRKRLTSYRRKATQTDIYYAMFCLTTQL